MDEDITGYRGQSHNKRGSLGAISFTLGVIALLSLLGAAGIIVVSYRQASLSAESITLTRKIVLLAAIPSLLGIIFAMVAFFHKRQKKGAAVTGLLLSLVVLLVSLGLTCSYEYIFGLMESVDLSERDLLIYQPKSDGEIIRETEVPQETVSPQDHFETTLTEITFEALTNEDLPEEALAKMQGTAPIGKSFLLDGSDNITNFLLMGLDVGGASDSMIVFSVDRVHHKVKMISIARDSYVLIPAFGTYSKLNYAVCWGGPEWTISTINYNYSMNISDYICVDMEQLEVLIDYVGGVDINVTYAEAPYLGVSAGMNLLTGSQAVSYARIREIDSEEARTGRQRTILIALLNKVLEMPMTDYPELIRFCMSMCKTSFDADELMSIAAEVAVGGYSIEQCALISQVDYWGGILGKEQYFYVVYDLNRASDILYRLIYEDLYVSGYMDPNEGAE